MSSPLCRAVDPEVVEVIWRAVEPLIPTRQVTHPLGCHRQRASDRACFAVMLVRLATGCSWEDAERLCGSEVSDTTVRDRRDEWIAARVFDIIAEEAIGGYDRIIGLDLSDVAVDGCLHKAPAGGRGPVRTRPTAASSDGSGRSSPTSTGSRSGGRSTEPTASTRSCSHRPSTTPPVDACSLISTPCGSTAVTTVESPASASPSADRRRDDRHETETQRRRGHHERSNGSAVASRAHKLVASNFGQLRRNTDRRKLHRLAQFALAVAVILTAKLIDWRNTGHRPQHLSAEPLTHTARQL